MRCSVPVLIVAFLLPLFVSSSRAEEPLSTPEWGAAPGSQSYPAIARDGDGWLAAWIDRRESPFRETAYAARLDAHGELLDPVDIRLFDGVGTVSVACGDGRCLVVDGATNFAVVENGRVVARGRDGASSGWNARVVFDGRDFAIFSGYETLEAVTIDRDGKAVGAPVTIIPFHGAMVLQDAAFNGSRFVILYTDTENLYTAIVGADGSPISTETFVDAGVTSAFASPLAASITTDGGELVAVWRQWLGGTIRVARFDAGGAIEGAPVTIPTPVITGNGVAIATEPDGFTLYLTEWEPSRLFSVSLSNDLQPRSTRELWSKPSFTVDTLAAAGGPEGSVVVASLAHGDQPGAASEIEALGTAMEPESSPVVVSRAAASQRLPRVATSMAGMLTVWEEDRGSGLERAEKQILGTLVDPTGNRSTFAIASSAENQTSPDVAGAGDSFLVVWNEGSSLRGRVVLDGGPTGDVLILSDEAASAGTVSSDGRDFFAAWVNRDTSVIELAHLTSMGDVLDGGSSIYVSTFFAIPIPRLACGRDDCIVTWADLGVVGPCHGSFCPTQTFILGARFDSALTLVDPYFFIAENVPDSIHLAIASHGDEYAMAWERNETVTARVIHPNDEMGDPIVVSGRAPALIRQGDSWLLLRETGPATSSHITGMRFDAESAGTDFTLHWNDRTQARSSPALAGNDTDVIAVYERTTRNEQAGGPPRIDLQPIAPAQNKRRAVR